MSVTVKTIGHNNDTEIRTELHVDGKKVLSNKSASHMNKYLTASSCAGYEYTMWFISNHRAKLLDMEARVRNAGYDCHISTTQSITALFIKTAELVEKIFLPGGDYTDQLWPQK